MVFLILFINDLLCTKNNYTYIFVLFHLFLAQRKFAERQGFEPWVPITQDSGFRDRPVQPLRHLSKKYAKLRNYTII